MVCAPCTERAVLFDVSFDLLRGQSAGRDWPECGWQVVTGARNYRGVAAAARIHSPRPGAELQGWSPDELGRHIRMHLPQDVTLFEGTIAENICRLEEEKDSHAIIAAAKAAGVHDMILPPPQCL